MNRDHWNPRDDGAVWVGVADESADPLDALARALDDAEAALAAAREHLTAARAAGRTEGEQSP